ncbi:RNA polymerase sigma factor [Aeribacillus pallidus]|uniref:RNA polymerase sigma factor n=1 Tax=Aeribacillus pallidus TaxID=33936 RepID=UPI003D2075C4
MTNFEEVYFQFFDDVYLYVLSLCHNESLAEEITQETFFKALKSIDKFKGECKMRVWLCQIAKNTYFSYFKKNKYITNEPCEEERIECFVQKLLSSETKLEIHKALHSLEEPYKEVFSLRIFGELSFLHIAEIFGKTENWARVTFYRSKHKLKEALK